LLTEQKTRTAIRTSLADWAGLALAPCGQLPARHHHRLINELESISTGDTQRLMPLLPPGSAKSTYASLNMLLGTLAAMATSVVSYWVGSSAGSARKDERIARLASTNPGSSTP
jgi:hypothetical protein